MTFSDALPVQFWLSGCDTYNQIEACGVHRACYCHEWQCDDHLVLQFTDDTYTDYYLSVIDEEDNSLEILNFNATPVLVAELFSETFESDLDGWLSGGFGYPYKVSAWSWSGGLAVSVVGQLAEDIDHTEILYKDYDIESGQSYSLDIDWQIEDNVGTQKLATLQIYVISGGSVVETFSVSSKEGATSGFYEQVRNYVFTPSVSGDQFGIGIIYSANAIQNIDVGIDNISVSEYAHTVFALSFVPSDYNICDQKIKLQILSETSPETIVAKSDCLNIKETVSCSNLIEYYNNRNYAGLIYEEQSPDVIFYLRIKSVFFHERYPQQDKPVQISLGREISGTSTVKTQRRLDVDMMPYYMHRKLILALSHQNVTIDNKSWTKAEEYEIADGDRRWPMKKASVFLTENNSVRRNVL